MAEEREQTERSEEPTQKRLDEAIRRGDVVKSQEVNTWFIIGAAALNLMIFSGSMSAGLETALRGLIANAHAVAFDGGALRQLVARLGSEILAAAAIPFLVLMAAAGAGNMIQHRLLWSAEPLRPALSKISPAAGLKRLFSRQALVNFAKGLAKLALVGGIMAALLWPERGRLDALVDTDPGGTLGITRALALSTLGVVVAVLTVIAALDYLWQYRQWYERQKMSLRELKEEFKQTEGDPTIKAKIRQLRQTRARKRMMAQVPKASVVITNPTHFAVALQYERGMNAPVCLAKGADAIALRIRAVAEEARIPIVENPPLARALHATVQLDQEIPPEHYKAVAEVISYVMRLSGAVRWWGEGGSVREGARDRIRFFFHDLEQDACATLRRAATLFPIADGRKSEPVGFREGLLRKTKAHADLLHVHFLRYVHSVAALISRTLEISTRIIKPGLYSVERSFAHCLLR